MSSSRKPRSSKLLPGANRSRVAERSYAKSRRCPPASAALRVRVIRVRGRRGRDDHAVAALSPSPRTRSGVHRAAGERLEPPAPPPAAEWTPERVRGDESCGGWAYAAISATRRHKSRHEPRRHQASATLYSSSIAIAGDGGRTIRPPCIASLRAKGGLLESEEAALGFCGRWHAVAAVPTSAECRSAPSSIAWSCRPTSVPMA